MTGKALVLVIGISNNYVMTLGHYRRICFLGVKYESYEFKVCLLSSCGKVQV